MEKDSVLKSCDAALAALAAGDTAALGVIYDCLGRTIYSVAYGVCGNKEDAEDVLQETLITALCEADKYRQGSNSRAWLLTVAKNRALDLLRRRRYTLPADSEEAEELADGTDPFEAVHVRDMLRVLKPAERRLLLLRLYSELPYEEISEITGVGVAALQKRYQRILKKLKCSMV